jgi:hypothetical protein
VPYSKDVGRGFLPIGWFRRRLLRLGVAAAFVATALVAPAAELLASAPAAMTVSADDCCPAGSHPPGECPLRHRRASAGHGSARDCRLACAQAGDRALLLVAGVLPVALPPIVPSPRVSDHALPLVARPLAAVRCIPSPPPKL